MTVVWPGLGAEQNVRDCSLGELVRIVRKLAEFRLDSKRSDFVTAVKTTLTSTNLDT